MQHNFLFPKVASPWQCASLWRNARHARVRWLCWHFFGHFRPEIRYGALPRRLRNIYKMLPIYSSSIWHKAFDPPRRSAIYNLTKSPTAKSLTGLLQRIRSAPQTQLSKVWLKTWKRCYSDGKCPLDGTWCQINNCQSSYKGEITPEETDKLLEFPGHSHAYEREFPDYDVALCKLTKFPRSPRDCACSQRQNTESFFPLEVHSAFLRLVNTVWSYPRHAIIWLGNIHGDIYYYKSNLRRAGMTISCNVVPITADSVNSLRPRRNRHFNKTTFSNAFL